MVSNKERMDEHKVQSPIESSVVTRLRGLSGDGNELERPQTHHMSA